MTPNLRYAIYESTVRFTLGGIAGAETYRLKTYSRMRARQKARARFASECEAAGIRSGLKVTSIDVDYGDAR